MMSIKVEKNTVLDPECSSEIIIPDPDFFTVNCDAITVTEVAGRAGGTGKNPILIVTQNGNTYRCNKRTKSDKTKKGIFMFACTKRPSQNCPFRFQAKMTLTEDPKNSQFWIKENWEIFKVFEDHTCVEFREKYKLERARLENEKNQKKFEKK